jgi:hypothetical protein
MRGDLRDRRGARASSTRGGNAAGERAGVSRGRSSDMKRAGSNCDRPACGVVKASGGLTRREGPNREEATRPTGSSCGHAPSGVAQVRRDGEHLEADSDLLSAILERDNLLRAWQQVKANRGAAGVDGITIDEFPDKFRAHWPQLRRALEEGTYEKILVL